MNIVLIITGLQLAGAERQVCDLADKFVEMGHRVLLVSLDEKVIRSPNRVEVQLISLNMQHSLLSFISTYIELRKLIRNFKPDVVHSHLFHANMLTRLLRLSTSARKWISTAHSTQVGGWFAKLCYRLTDFLVDISTNVSDVAVRAFIEAGAMRPGKMITVHNGIDVIKFQYNPRSREKIRSDLSVSSNTLFVLSVGRLTEQKDYPNLLQAFSTVHKSIPNTVLVIIGTGSLLEKLTKTVKVLRLEHAVMFLGAHHNITEWMSAADTVVLSSESEGFGLVLAEAMACERIVVATDCGGTKEVLGENGYLIPRKNSIALADGIVEALSLSSEEKEHQGKLARTQIVTNFSLETVANTWIKLYQDKHKAR